MPFELRPYPTPTLRPEGEYLRTAWERSVYPMAERLGAEIRLPAVSPQPYTRLAFEGLQYAKDHGKAGEYNDRVFRAFFQESRDIGRAEVLAELASEIGLDGADFRRALQAGEYRERHRRALEHAYGERRVRAVPLFVVGNRLLEGWQPAEALERAIEAARSGDVA